jgi:hypothetical protein
MTKRRSHRDDLPNCHCEKAVDAVTAELDAKIQTLKRPDKQIRMNAVMEARSRAMTRPKAGETFQDRTFGYAEGAGTRRKTAERLCIDAVIKPTEELFN